MARVEERRNESRVPLEMYLTTYVQDRPLRGFTANVSESGLYINTRPSSRLPQRTWLGLELELPGVPETIWAAGELCYDELDDYFLGNGIRFVAMARRHLGLLSAFLTGLRQGKLPA